MAETRISPPDTARCHFVPASDTPKHSHAARSACTALRRAGGAGGQALPPASPSERTGLGAASSPASTSRSPSVGSAACSKGRTDAPWPSCLLPPLFPHLVLASAPPPLSSSSLLKLVVDVTSTFRPLDLTGSIPPSDPRF